MVGQAILALFLAIPVALITVLVIWWVRWVKKGDADIWLENTGNEFTRNPYLIGMQAFHSTAKSSRK